MKKFTLKDILTFRNILDTKKKYTFIWSVIFQFPILSLLAGAPLNYDASIFSIDEITAQLIETMSYTLGIIGTISVGIFTIKRNNDDKHKDNRKLVEDTEERLCILIDTKTDQVLKKIEDKFDEQTKLQDEKLKNVYTQISHLKDTDKETNRKIYRMESKIFNFSHNYYDEHQDTEHYSGKNET